MSAQRFVASNATDALRRIKAELGGDAVVLSSREVPEGVEILAIAAADLVTLAPQQPPPQPQPRAQASPPLPTTPETPMTRTLQATAAILATLAQLATLPAARAADTSPAPAPAAQPAVSPLAAAQGHLKAQRWAAAVDELKRVNASGDADWNNLMGYALRKLAKPDLDGAQRHYDAALRINPNHQGALEYAGELALMKCLVSKVLRKRMTRSASGKSVTHDWSPKA